MIDDPQKHNINPMNRPPRNQDPESPRNKQEGGEHYTKFDVQPWDIIDWFKLNFYEGNILKYLLRKKGDRVEDLRKLIHYAEKEIENEQKHIQ